MIRRRRSWLWFLFFLLFPQAVPDDTIIAFGRLIFIPAHKPLHLSGDLMVHEKVHLKQQHHSFVYAVWWWLKYFWSRSFRYSQELEAYRAQLEVAPRFVRQIFGHSLAEALSGPAYGSLASFEQALRDLKARGD